MTTAFSGMINDTMAKSIDPSERDDVPHDRPLRISLVTPNFNGADYIEDTLKSVASQGAGDIEHIIVDGGSRDGSMAIIERYRAGASAIICEPDRGHADAVNKGFARSTGDIMGWINSDDILLPGALAAVERLFRLRPDVEWVTGRASSMDSSGRIVWVGPVRAWSRLRFLAGDNKWIQQESTFWRRSLWDRAGGALDGDYKLANDFDLWARFFRFAELHTLGRHLGCFRIRPGQRSIAFKKQYEAEAKSIVRRELRRLEPSFRKRFGRLMPDVRGPLSIGADHRYAICDPPIIETPIRRSSNGKGAVAIVDRPTEPSDLTRFRGVHRGERCFIMGNGPSLNQMDLSKLAGQTVFACNSVFLLFDRIDWRPRYYTCVDSRVLPDRAFEIDDMLRRNPEMAGFFPVVIQEHTGKKVRRATRLIMPAGRNRYFFNETTNSTDRLPHSMFSNDINDRIIQPHTVAITMMQIAAYMGFRELILIGCDTDYAVAESVRREKDGASPGVALTSSRDDDENHFDPRYFGRRRKWHQPRPDKMIMHYGYAKDALDAMGIAVYNATVGGKLEVFPRKEFELLLEKSCMNAAAETSIRPLAAEPVSSALSSPVDARSFMRDAASVGWRARRPALALVAAALAIAALSLVPALKEFSILLWFAAGFSFLFGLIVMIAVTLRGFIADLSRQLMDLANGAGRPIDDNLIERARLEAELGALRDEVERLKAKPLPSPRN